MKDMQDFDIAKYLREHQLGSYGILNHYVDLKPLKEDVPTPDRQRSIGDDYAECIRNAKTEEEIGFCEDSYFHRTGHPVRENTYEGPEHKLTGNGEGDEFDQVDPVSEAEDEEENPWMYDVDATEAYKIGNWTCEYDHPGVLVWSYKNVPYSKLAVYATPNWENEGTTPIQIDIDEETQDNMTLKQSEFEDFNEYATAMKPYLDRIEDLESNWGSLAELEKPEDVYADDQEEVDDTRIMDLGGNMIEQGIIRLMDDGFSAEDVLELCQMLVNDQYGAKAQGTPY